MAKNKKTPKEAMRYWWVGFGRGMKIKARTARVAARKYMRDNLSSFIDEKDSCPCCHDLSENKVWPDSKKKAKTYDVKDIPVKPYDEN